MTMTWITRDKNPPCRKSFTNASESTKGGKDFQRVIQRETVLMLKVLTEDERETSTRHC